MAAVKEPIKARMPTSVLPGGIPWKHAAFTGLGAVFDARLAPWLSRYVNPDVLKTIFAVISISAA